MDKFVAIGDEEYHISIIKDIYRGDDAVGIVTDSDLFSLPLSNFRDVKSLERINKGDEIIYVTCEGGFGIGEGSNGIQRVFFPAYEI